MKIASMERPALTKLVEATDIHTSTAMTVLRTTPITVLSIWTLVSRRERTSGTAMSSITVMTTLVMSTTVPRVAQMMNGIHTRAKTYTMMVDLRACSRSPRRMRDRGPTDPAKGAAAMNTRPLAYLPRLGSLRSMKYARRGMVDAKISPRKIALKTDL